MKRIYSIFSVLILFSLLLPTTVLADRHLTDENFRYEIDDNEVVVEKYLGNDSFVTVPSTLGGFPVLEIEEDCFRNNRALERVKISEGIVEIGEDAFSNCPSLTEVEIPSSVRKIEKDAFSGSFSVTIIGAAGSRAETYANRYNIPFKTNGNPQVNTGVSVRDIKLNSDHLTLNPGESSQLSWRIIPENATNKNVRFVSKNPAVARVSEAGLVTAVKSGKTEITVITEDGNHDDDCDVIVSGRADESGDTRLRDIKLSRDDIYLEVGETFKLEVSFYPQNAATSLIWTSSNPSVARVNDDGTVLAVGNGKAEITVITADGRHDEDCDVRVGKTDTSANIKDIHLDRDDLILNIGEEAKLNATISPKNASTSLIWTSSNTNVATVDQEGNVKAIGSGKAEITVITEDGRHDDDCDVFVRQKDTKPDSSVIPVRDVDIEDDLYLAPGAQHQLSIFISPSNASNQKVSFKSTVPDVATVDQFGIVRAISEGRTKIIVTTEDGNHTDDCDVYVSQSETSPGVTDMIPVRDVDIDDEIFLKAGETYQLTALISPRNASNQNVSWESKNPAIATVSEDGLIKGVSKGTTQVVVITEDNNHRDSCDVTVIGESEVVPVEEVFLDSSSMTITQGESLTLRASILPTYAVNNGLNWESSDSNIATINKSGVVRAQNPGEAIISAKSENNKEAQCKVLVVKDETRSTPILSYSVHVQDRGWETYVTEGESAGTTGMAKRLEAIKIKLSSDTGSIRYKTHVEDFGWQDWTTDDNLSGTTGKAKRLEAIAIELTGGLENDYDIYYRVHAENLGWMNWAKNGENAGSQGLALRLEAIQIKLVPKDSNPPTPNPPNKTDLSFKKK